MINRKLSVVLVTTILSVNLSVLAQKTTFTPSKSGSPVSEIYELLEENNLSLEEVNEVKVIFQLSENKEIQVRKVKTSNDKIRAFILDRLKNQVLSKQGWHLNKLYEVPITLKP